MPERIELNPDWPWASKFRIAQGVRIGRTVSVLHIFGFHQRVSAFPENMGSWISALEYQAPAPLVPVPAPLFPVPGNRGGEFGNEAPCGLDLLKL